MEPLKVLTAQEVRRALARCIFRSGVPRLIRCDRGPEFKNALIAEFLALASTRHRVGFPWRPTDQAGVERFHQEMQKILGIIILDVLKAVPSFWSEALVVVEFVIYNLSLIHI